MAVSCLRVAVAVCLLAALVWLAGQSCLLARADWLASSGDSEDLRRAIALMPANSRYHLRLAELESGVEGNRRALAHLQRAVRVNPRETTARLLLAFRSELAGDDPQAEQSLLLAARYDREFNPRWFLANYYFRRQQWDPFWTWLRASAEIASSDFTPLFQLAWEASSDPALILRRAIPPRPEVEREYLAFLLSRRLLDPAAAVARRRLAAPDPLDTPLLAAYCDALLAAAASSPDALPGALEVWNTLAARGLLPYSPLRPERNLSLTNGTFLHPPQSRGFDWRLHNPPGVSVALSRTPPALVIDFSGRQPENCRLLSQFLPVVAGRSYRLAFEYRTPGLAPGNGLSLDLSGIYSLPLAADDWQPESFSFQAPTGLATLALAYRRPLGRARIEGSIELRDFRLERALP
ncbi:MAG: hypothetical protein IT158_14545 [Bryobacterales bacterium]|nr:hypothetical protein [Bryobacterales bacterium]